MTLPTTKQSRATAGVTPLSARVLLVGSPKHGKTTLVSRWAPESTLIIDTHNGTRLLDGEHYVEHVQNWRQFDETVNLLVTTTHQYRTVVIDLADDVWKFVDQHVGEARKAPGGLASAKDDYQKAIGEAEGTFRTVVGRLLASDLGIWFISHSKTVAENGIQRHVSRLDGRVYTYIAGACDFVLLAEKMGPKYLLHTQSSARFEAGCRVMLPEPLELDARKLYAAINRGLAGKPPEKPAQEPANVLEAVAA